MMGQYLRQVRDLDRCRIEPIETIDAQDIVLLAEQPFYEVRADEASTTCNRDSHGPVLPGGGDGRHEQLASPFWKKPRPARSRCLAGCHHCQQRERQ